MNELPSYGTDKAQYAEKRGAMKNAIFQQSTGIVGTAFDASLNPWTKYRKQGDQS